MRLLRYDGFFGRPRVEWAALPTCPWRVFFFWVLSEETDVIQFQCTNCRGVLKVRDELEGKNGRCPKCGTVNVIPSGSSEGDCDAVSGRSADLRSHEDPLGELAAAANRTEDVRNEAVGGPVSAVEGMNEAPVRSAASDGVHTPGVVRSSAVPSYDAVKIVGYLLVGLGFVCIGIAPLVFLIGVVGGGVFGGMVLTFVPALVLGLTGLFQIGMGQLLFCVRDIAINSFRLAKL